MAGPIFGDVGVALFVAGAKFVDVGVALFVAGAIFADVGASLFVAGSILVKFGFDSRSAKCCIVPQKMCLQSEPAGVR